MIFTKYLVKKIFKNQLIILFVLFLVFFCQKFVKILHIVIDINVSKYLAFLMFSFYIPEIIKFILPISLFFSILMTFNYLHFNNEIIAMYACGLGHMIVVRSVLYVSGITTVFAVINVCFLSPWCSYHQHEVFLKTQSDFSTTKLFERKFQVFKNINTIFFVDNYYDKKFQNIFLIRKMSNNYYFLITANYGYLEQSFDGLQWVVLDYGQCYIWNNGYVWNDDIVNNTNFYISCFDKYKFLFNQDQKYYTDSSTVLGMFMHQLWFSNKSEACAEFHWRLILIFIIVIMAMIILPLSLKLNKNYFLNIFPALILYLVFFLLQVSFRFYISNGYFNLVCWVWSINIFYMFIAIVLNFWDSVISRHVRLKLMLLTLKD